MRFRRLLMRSSPASGWKWFNSPAAPSSGAPFPPSAAWAKRSIPAAPSAECKRGGLNQAAPDLAGARDRAPLHSFTHPCSYENHFPPTSTPYRHVSYFGDGVVPLTSKRTFWGVGQVSEKMFFLPTAPAFTRTLAASHGTSTFAALADGEIVAFHVAESPDIVPGPGRC